MRPNHSNVPECGQVRVGHKWTPFHKPIYVRKQSLSAY